LGKEFFREIAKTFFSGVENYFDAEKLTLDDLSRLRKTTRIDVNHYYKQKDQFDKQVAVYAAVYQKSEKTAIGLRSELINITADTIGTFSKWMRMVDDKIKTFGDVLLEQAVQKQQIWRRYLPLTLPSFRIYWKIFCVYFSDY
jgi:rhodanese-related sulfurtransferase